jgi:exosortase
MTPARRTLLFGASSLCLLSFSAGVVRALIDVSTHNATASHIVLVPFVSLALIYRRRESIFGSVQWGGPAAIAVILIGAGLAWFGSLQRSSGMANDSLSTITLALVVLWAGGFMLFYGQAACRAALFPLLFLGFTIPIPNVLLEGFTQFLKAGSAETVASLFTLLGTPYHREGFVFALPSFTIEIVDACSGIRSSLALLLTGLLADHLFLATRWKQAVLILAVVPLAMVKNAIRIVALTLLATHVDAGFLTGQLHHEGGVVFYLLALAILAPLLVVLHNSEGDHRARGTFSSEFQPTLAETT